ncbi:MAG TPA: anti-sigma factor [Thermoanaerobaculia bacterium]|nr:anti-sigma factor [Thermoanaerobaculia bacterium]
MNGQAHSEDLTILAVVETLERGNEDPGAPRTGDAEETLARLYTEVLGLVACELAPVSPSAGAKARLLAAVRGETVAPPPTPQAMRDPAPPTLPEPIRLTSVPAQPARSGGIPTPVRRPASLTPPPRRAVRPSRWPLVLAASLAFLFAGLSAWLYTELDRQRDTIEALGRQMDRERSRVDGAIRQARRAEADAMSMQEKFALVTSPAVEASPMRPAGATPLQPAARGVLFVASDHQHWYLCLHGMAPAPQGKTYKLWFVADGGTVSGGVFTARPGEPVELSSKQMPAGTKAAVITLEDDPQAAKPAGPEVLRAAGVYQLS